METAFLINDRERTSARPDGSVLLDVLREDFGLTGAKDGCREGDCGTCLVLAGRPQSGGVVYQAVNSCLFPVGEAAGLHIVTVEGLSGPALSPVQEALIDEGAVQCGFCTPGLVIALTGFLLGGAPLSEAEGLAALGGNICRCTGHVAIKRTIARLGRQFAVREPSDARSPAERVAALVERRILPAYFLEVPERLRALAPSPAGPRPGNRAPVLVAGGTDLFVTRAADLQGADLDFLARRPDLRGIRMENETCVVGAATPLAEIASSPVLRRARPDLAPFLACVASAPVRNRATLAGNIVNASPAGDMSIMLLALNASLVLARGDQKRSVALREFFRGYKVLDLAAGEMITEILFPAAGMGDRFHFEKVARRERLDIAGVNAAIGLRVREGRILEAHAAAGSVAPIPLYLEKTSAYLRGRTVDAETARGAAGLAGSEIAPISDVRGSAEYKRALLPRLVLAHFLTLFPESIREEDVA